MRLWRTQREWADLASDPRTPYMIGRLLGANEMAVALLEREPNETAVRVSEVIDRVLGYFMEEAVGQPRTTETTLVLPPKS